jgi:subtilase family serine protease
MALRLLLILCGLMPFTLTMVPAIAQGKPEHGPLITQNIDDGQLTTLSGNTRPEVRRATARTPVPSERHLEHVHLLLKRSPGQERGVENFVDGLTKPGSPSYHRWVSATEFGRRFGAADADVNRINGWLRAKGFTVNLVYPNRMMIDFSGTVGQVRDAFHTEIDQMAVSGVSHIANISDPKIPTALTPAVEGIVSLHDFHPHNAKSPRRADTANCGGAACYAVAPGDLATIYDLGRLFASGYTGRGQVIATVESTDLYSSSDWATFRNTFRLNQYPGGNLQVVHPAPAGGIACGDPGVRAGDDGEAALDTEWATAAAPGATIMLASCVSSGATNGVFLAIQNLVNSANPPPMISVSYALCEAYNGAASNAAFNKLYQQAAAEGISVFVATGDSGASDCSPGPGAAQSGIGINGWGNSQYNVAVGGTDFRDKYDGTTASYWRTNSGAPWSTARSYIPEIPWNDNCANTFLANYFGGTDVTYGVSGFCNTQNGFQSLSSGGGGPSQCYSGSPAVSGVASGTCKAYPKPAWQRLVAGYVVDGARDVPDISVFAADGIWGHSYATCFSDPNSGGGPCTGNPALWKGNGGGTSYGAPIMAGIQALINQHKGARQGNPAPIYYQLAARQYGASGNPNCSADLGNSIEQDCMFHDVVSGTTDIYCGGGYNCYLPSGNFGVLSISNSGFAPAYNAKRGYDLATGIGSVDAYNIVMNWP